MPPSLDETASDDPGPERIAEAGRMHERLRSLVVGGRYLVRGSTYGDMLRIAAALIQRERAVRR